MGFETRITDEVVDGVSGWVWPRNDRGLWLGPSQEWPHFKEIISKHLTSFNTVVQAGGACGMYPKLLSKMFAVVYTFEPDAYNFYCLAQNCPESNIFKFNAALSDRLGNVTFHEPAEDNRGVGRIIENTDKKPWQGNTPALTVDTFHYEKLDLLYLDVEGSEARIIQGALQSIRKHRPMVVCENAHSDGIMNVLINEGYSIIDKYGSDTFFVPYK